MEEKKAKEHINSNNTSNNINNGENKEKNEIKETIVKDHKYYAEEIKKFLNINTKDPDYYNKIQKEPETLFQFVDEYKIENWEKVLTNGFQDNKDSKTPTDEQIMSVEKNTEYQRVIKNDCNRTRVRESVLIENFKQILENIITYYCKSKGIFYKQGLNEIFGPLLLMKFKYKQLSYSTIFTLGEAFIDKYLPNYFYEKELYSLKSSLGALLILIRYHEPSVYNRLDSMEILPEMYATNWVMTLLLGKVKLDILYNLWDYILSIDDPLFMHYFFVSMIINRREMIINCDKNILPTLMASLTIISNEELDNIVKKAKELIKETPYSFRILVNKLGFLIKKNKKVKQSFEKYKPLSLPAMPIFPLETLFITYHSEIDCPSEKCKNSKKIKNKFSEGFEIVEKDDDDDENNKYFKCEKCDLNVEKNMNFFLLDLRILEYGLNKEENESDKTGYLPLMINVDQEELKSEEINDIITKRYINERGKFHFIFLTTNTEAFLSFEEKFYKENISEEDQKKIMFGLMEKKSEKELDLNSDELTKKQLFKLKEYDNLRKILKSLKKQNYPYIGFVYGGFDALHKESIEYGIELLFHSSDTCILCQQKNKQKKKVKEKKNQEEKDENVMLKNSLWEKKTKIKYKELNTIFKEETSKIFFASLINYKNKHLESEKIQLLIAAKTNEYKIKIYKFLNNQIDLKSREGYYGLGIDDENKEVDLIELEEIGVQDVLKLNFDKKNKNIATFEIMNNEIDDDKNKKKDKKIENIILIIDFSSINDSKRFVHIFKDMTIAYKNYYKKKFNKK